MNIMTKKDAIDCLNAIDTFDPAEAHRSADAVLLEFLRTNGFEDVVRAWNDVDDRYNGFWYG